MHLRRRNTLFAVTMLITAAAVAAAASPRYRPSTHVVSRTNARAQEIRRVHAHFDSVIRELDSATPTHLSSGQSTRRDGLITALRRYRDREAFPRNYDFETATPYFVDRKTGALCAVAHLLASTAHSDIVDRIARTNNNVRAADLAIAEATRINRRTVAIPTGLTLSSTSPLARPSPRWGRPSALLHGMCWATATGTAGKDRSLDL